MYAYTHTNTHTHTHTQEGVVNVGAEEEAGGRIRQGLLAIFLSKRKHLLDSLRPFVHRSQALGDKLN
jgi:hypothetical protein